MSNISVNIDVDSISQQVKKLEEKQQQINEAYEKMKTVQKNLQLSWTGKAANKYYQYFDIIEESKNFRIKPVDDAYIPFLNDFIVNGYINVEELNQKIGKDFQENAALKEFL